MRLLKSFFLLLVFFSLGFCWPKPAEATQFDLLAPTETLTMGQDVKFTITVDTQSSSLSTIQIGLTYDTQYLQFLNVMPGNTFSTINYTTPETGKVLLTASNPTAFSGSGTFAYVNFKLIAGSPGSTELCALYNPTTQPTSPPQQPTSPPNPTRLPTSGEANITQSFAVLGFVFLLITFGGFYLARKNYF